MWSDILTIIWKELKEFLLQRGSSRATAANLIIMVLVFGVFLPFQQGRAWVQSPLSMITWGWVPLFLVTGLIADSFAGERERHTLETLLASRLSDTAILLGKILAAITYGMGMIVIFMITSLVTVNVSDWTGKIIVYPLTTFLAILIVAILGTGLVSCIGVIVSLRATTVRQAAQSLSLGIIMVVWIPILLVMLLPKDIVAQIKSAIAGLDPALIIPLLLVSLAAVDLALLAVAAARFQRARLILD